MVRALKSMFLSEERRSTKNPGDSRHCSGSRERLTWSRDAERLKEKKLQRATFQVTMP